MRLCPLCQTVTVLVAFAIPVANLPAQDSSPMLSAKSLSYARGMLRDAYKELKNNYYDPKYRGVDLDARLHEYDALMDKSRTTGDSFRVIAAFLGSVHDSHVYFRPPSRAARFESGYRIQMVGDKCFVTRIEPGSDAEEKLQKGDEVLKFNGYTVTRGNLEDIQYRFRLLAPAVEEHLSLKAPDGSERQETIKASVKVGDLTVEVTKVGGDGLASTGRREIHESKVVESGDVSIWKMRKFGFDDRALDDIMEHVKKHSVLILDLRGNPGGRVDSLKLLVGRLFDHDVKIADVEARKPAKPEVAKRVGKAYGGKVIVLVDSDSGSASELFARVIQLEHRGTIIGDRTAGEVMESEMFQDYQGAATGVIYGFSITRANLLMTDGKSLEGTGVIPDEILLPTAEDLAEGRDPVLARAAALGGLELDPRAATKLFPYHWPKL